MHDGDGIAGRRVVGCLVHGGPVLITNTDIDHVAGRNSHNVAVCIVGVIAAVGVQISLGLEVLICGGIVDARDDLLIGDDQEIIGGRTAIRRSQHTAAEGQTGQRCFIVRPRAAEVLAKIHGIHDVDHIAGFQATVFDREGSVTLIDHPVIQRTHPASTGRATFFFQRFIALIDGCDVGGLGIGVRCPIRVAVPCESAELQRLKHHCHHAVVFA